MKKLLFIGTFVTLFSAPVFGASIQDLGSYLIPSKKQGQEDTSLSMEKIESVAEAQIRKLIMGSIPEWARSALGYVDFPLTEVSSDTVASLSGSETGASTKKYPEGQKMVELRDKELMASTDMGKELGSKLKSMGSIGSVAGAVAGKLMGEDTASAKNTGETKMNRERAITQLGSHAYALALVNRTVASRSLGDGKSSTNKQASKKLSSATDNTSAIATTSSVTLSTSETLNSLLNISATSNSLGALSITEQNSATANLLNPLNGMGSFGGFDSSSALGGGIGGSLGSTLKSIGNFF